MAAPVVAVVWGTRQDGREGGGVYIFVHAEKVPFPVFTVGFLMCHKEHFTAGLTILSCSFNPQ